MEKQTKNILIICLKFFLIIVALAFGIFGGICLKEAFAMNDVIKEMKKPLVQMPIDISKPITVSKELPPVREYFHGLGLWIELKTTEKDESVLGTLVEGIGGVVSITEADDEVIHRFTIKEDDLICYPSRQGVDKSAYIAFLERIPEFASNSSQLTIQIDQEAKKLNGVEQTLIVKYNLCGLESLNLMIVSGVGIISTLAGLGVGIPTIVSLRIKGVKN